MHQRRIKKHNHTSRKSTVAQAEPKKDLLAEIITCQQRVDALLRESNEPYAMVGSALLFSVIFCCFLVEHLKFLINDPFTQKVQTLLLEQQSLQQDFDKLYGDIEYNLDELGVYLCGPIFQAIKQLNPAIAACFTALCNDNAYFLGECLTTIAKGADKLIAQVTDFEHVKDRFHSVASQLIAMNDNDPYFINPAITSCERYAELINRGAVNLDTALENMSEMNFSAKLNDLGLRGLLFNKWLFFLGLAYTYGGCWCLNNVAQRIIPVSWHLLTPLPDTESIDFLTEEEAQDQLKIYKRIERELTQKVNYNRLLTYSIFILMFFPVFYECFFGEAWLPLPFTMMFFQMLWLAIRSVVIEVCNGVDQYRLDSQLAIFEEKLMLIIKPLINHDNAHITLNLEKTVALSSFTINVKDINFEEKKVVVKSKRLIHFLRNSCILCGANIISFTRNSLTIGTKKFNNAKAEYLFARILDRLVDVQVLMRQLRRFSERHLDLNDPLISLIENNDHLPIVEARWCGNLIDPKGRDDITRQLQQIFTECKVQWDGAIYSVIGCKPGLESGFQKVISNLRCSFAVSPTRKATHDYYENAKGKTQNLRKYYPRIVAENQESNGGKGKKIILYREPTKEAEPQVTRWTTEHGVFIFDPNDSACRVMLIDSHGYFPPYNNFIIFLLTKKHFKKRHQGAYREFKEIAEQARMGSNCKIVTIHGLHDCVYHEPFTANLELTSHSQEFGKMRVFAKKVKAQETGKNLFMVVSKDLNPKWH